MLRLFIFTFLFFTMLEVAGQNTIPHYKHYTLRDGLSQMQVISLFQDSRGYIWIGTKAGLNCFNGEKFVSYTTKKFPEIDNDYIRQICEDSSGHIWANTITGIFRVDGNNLKFFKIEDNLITWMAADASGKIWFSKVHNSDFKVSIHYIDGESVKTLPVDFPKYDAIPHVELKYVKGVDELLLVVNNLIYRIKNVESEIIHRNNNLVHFFPIKDKVFFTDGIQINFHAEDIYNFDLKSYENGEINVLAKIRDGKLAENIRLNDTLPNMCLNIGNCSFLLSPSEIEYNAFQGINANCVLRDREGKIWVGSEDGFYLPFGNEFVAYKQEVLPQIWAVTEDNKGTIWFSSYLYGLYNNSGDKIEKYSTSYPVKVSDFYFHPSVDKLGRLFFPNATGILITDGRQNKQYRDQLYLTTFYDSERDLIWGGLSKGAAAFDANQKKIRLIDEKLGLDVGNYVLTIGKDTSGYYWFGGGAGLARYNWQNNSLKNYKPGNRNTGVYTQRNDYTGRTWFGTKNGLYWYNKKTDSLNKIESDELNDVVNMLEPIDSSWLIVSQPFGIYLFDLQTYYNNGEIRLYLFNENNGFLGVEPGQDGAFTDSQGNIWMTTSTELMKLNPKELKIGKHELDVRIDKCNGQKLQFTQEFIEFPKNQNSGIFTFDAICFSRPKPVQYSWKLENDTVWSAWQEEDYAVITSLPDGKSEIQVRARVPGLPGSLAESSMLLKVSVAIWKQTWFFPALFGFFVVLTLIVFVLFVQTRTKMIQTSKQAKAFQVKAIQSQMNPHFIFNVLASFQTMILSLNVEKANQYLVKLATLVRGFLDASTQNGKSMHDEEEWHPIQKEIELIEGFVDFQQLIYPEKFTFNIKIAEEIDVENETIPPMILQPFIENSIRHGLLPKDFPGNLWLRIDRIGNKGISITVEDDGIGIEKAGKILNDSPFRYESKGSMLTLNRIKLMNELGFQITVKTISSDKGTKIIIRLPKNDK